MNNNQRNVPRRMFNPQVVQQKVQQARGNVAPRVPAPQGLPVHVGQEEHLWTSAMNVSSDAREPQGKVQIIDNNNQVNVDQLQGAAELRPDNYTQEEIRNWRAAAAQQPKAENTVTHTWHNTEFDAQQRKVEAQQQSGPMSKPGNIIVYDGDRYLFTSETEESAKQKLEQLLLNQELNIDTIAVYKHLDIDFGIILK